MSLGDTIHLVCPGAGSTENKLGGKWGWEMLEAGAHPGLPGHLRGSVNPHSCLIPARGILKAFGHVLPVLPGILEEGTQRSGQFPPAPEPHPGF